MSTFEPSIANNPEAVAKINAIWKTDAKMNEMTEAIEYHRATLSEYISKHKALLGERGSKEIAPSGAEIKVVV